MTRKDITEFIHRSRETLVYISFWVLMFIIPILMMYVRSREHIDEVFSWNEIFHMWRIDVAFLIIFFIHNFLLAPLLVYKKHYKKYFIITGIIIFGFAVYQFTFRPERRPRPRNEFRKEIVEKDRHGEKMDDHPDFKNGEPTPPPGMHHRPFMVEQVDFISVIVLILMLGMNLGIKLLFKQESDEKKMQELKNENLHQQLEYLKYQINPHFFMNTLNNIHALVDIDPEEAKESIIELSKLMRYVLYDANRQTTSLQKEAEFLDNYIELMRLRYSDKVDIKVDVDKDTPDVQIAPLITITYIENAFKHGISYNAKSFIHISSHVVDGHLIFNCVNSKHKESTAEHGGVGLENTRKRLDLIYGDSYKLDIKDADDTYTVHLEVPVGCPSTDDGQSKA